MGTKRLGWCMTGHHKDCPGTIGGSLALLVCGCDCHDEDPTPTTTTYESADSDPVATWYANEAWT